MKRVIFMGTPNYAEVILKRVIEDGNFEVVMVLTQPDKRVGRKRVLQPPPVKVLAQKHNIELLQPTTLKNPELVKKLKEKEPDFIIVAAYGMILPKEILNIAPSINLHASILPKYRGASPIQQTILNLDRFGGVTAMLMDEHLDTGEILGYRFLEIKDYNLQELMEILSYQAGDLTISILREFERLNPIRQTHATSSHCRKIKREDGLVDFESATDIFKKYRAYYGWPGIFFEDGLKVVDMELLEESSKNRAGEILSIDGDFITVGCGRGSVKFKTLQPKSKAKMSAKAYILGKRKKVGDTLL